MKFSLVLDDEVLIEFEKFKILLNATKISSKIYSNTINQHI